MLVHTDVQDNHAIGETVALGQHTVTYRDWKNIRTKAGVPDVTIHDLRRTYITRLMSSGADVGKVQKLAGHYALQTTMTYYTWTSDDELRAAVRKLRQTAS